MGSRSGVLFNDDAKLSEMLGIPETKAKGTSNGKVICSFCKGECYPLEATYGYAKPRKIINLKVTADSFEDEIKHVADLKTACPACCLNIQPLENCRGERMTNGPKFTLQSEG